MFEQHTFQQFLQTSFCNYCVPVQLFLVYLACRKTFLSVPRTSLTNAQLVLGHQVLFQQLRLLAVKIKLIRISLTFYLDGRSKVYRPIVYHIYVSNLFWPQYRTSVIQNASQLKQPTQESHYLLKVDHSAEMVQRVFKYTTWLRAYYDVRIGLLVVASYHYQSC